jgi:hypothetical protein
LDRLLKKGFIACSPVFCQHLVGHNEWGGCDERLRW